MPVSDDLQLEPASYLLLVFLYKCNSHSRDDRTSTAKYVETHKSEIEATCRVLEWLRLAAPARQSPFGWKASNLLVDLIVNPRKRLGRSAKAGIESWEENVIDMICEAALGNLDHVTGECLSYIRWFFGSLGLMNINDDGDWSPNRRLLNLAAESRFEKERQRDKKLYNAKNDEDLNEFGESDLHALN
jgi:hypothetical protein